MFIFSLKKGGDLLCGIFLFFCIQVQAQTDSVKVIEDFNGDKYLDTLLTYYDGGGSFGGRFCELREGKKGTLFELDTWSDFGSIYQVTLLPPQLEKRKYKDFLLVIKRALLPKEMPKPDPSLSWIIQANTSKKDTLISGPYSFLFSYSPTWFSGDIDIPEAYFLSISGDTLREMYHPPLDAPGWYNPETTTGWLVYYSHNHSRSDIAVLDSRDSLVLKATAHGVILSQGNSHQWIFITDGHLTRGPEKLRWPSVNKAVFFKDLVIVEQALAPHMVVNYYVIDPATGKCAQIDTEYLWDPHVKNIEMEISEGMFRVRWDGDEGKVYSYQALREGL